MSLQARSGATEFAAVGEDPIDTSVAHSSRVWNGLLGGKDNYPADRQAVEQLIELYPGIFDVAGCSRYFHSRMVRYLAGEEGIGQFVDLGVGLPTVDNTHEVAGRVTPNARVVYVDNDPVVAVHARALLTGLGEVETHHVQADLCQTGALMTAVAESLDLTRPVAVLMTSVMRHIDICGPDDEQARDIVRQLVKALPSGSHVSICEATSTDPGLCAAVDDYNQSGADPWSLRTPDQLRACLTVPDLQLVPPGIVPAEQWHPEPQPFDTRDVPAWGGVSRVVRRSAADS
ncbi:SAM-dependent methyltransferase [Actinomadura sp. 6N118]|uniref:SAM-dependent methyltransferase n=1 Tax=Actinomadura sp. 6N118 TaxID=3375151 RepID=UPI0037A9D66F